MNSQQAKQIDIVDFLESNHIKFSRQIGDNYWYCSPYRKEKTPSFKVDRSKNLWFDHGTGNGGNIIDLVLKIEKCTVSEALNILDNNTYSLLSTKDSKQSSLFDDNLASAKFRKKNNKQEILKINNLENTILINYIKLRKIDIKIAKKYLLEIYYSYLDKKYFALALKNDSNGYETRSKYFKGTIGSKNITTIKGIEKEKVVIFEGFFDFLSALTYYKKQEFKSDVIILNSVAFVNSVLNLLENYREVFLFLDNDKAGQEAKNLIEANFEGKIIDKSKVYEKYNDFNEFLQ